MKNVTERRRTPEEADALRKKKPPKQPKPPKELMAIENGPLGAAVALMFWKLRNRFPDFAITISEQEVKDMKASLNYTEQEPQIIVEARPNFVVVRAADQHGDIILVAESTQDQQNEKERMARFRRLKESAPMLASTVRNELAGGIISNESINALCEAATAMARE